MYFNTHIKLKGVGSQFLTNGQKQETAGQNKRKDSCRKWMPEDGECYCEFLSLPRNSVCLFLTASQNSCRLAAFQQLESQLVHPHPHPTQKFHYGREISLNKCQLPAPFHPHTPTLCLLCAYYCISEEGICFGTVGLHQVYVITHVNKSHARSKEKKNLAHHQSLIFVSPSFTWKKARTISNLKIKMRSSLFIIKQTKAF